MSALYIIQNSGQFRVVKMRLTVGPVLVLIRFLSSFLPSKFWSDFLAIDQPQQEQDGADGSKKVTS